MSFADTEAAPNTNEVDVSTSRAFSYVFISTFCSRGSSVTSITDTAGLTYFSVSSFDGWGGVIEVWAARATEPITNDTVTASFSGSPAMYYVAAGTYSGIDWTTPYGGGIVAFIANLIATNAFFIVSDPAALFPYLGYIAQSLASVLNNATDIYAAFAATDNPDTFSCTSFQEITGVTGGADIGTGTGTTTTPGITDEPLGPPSTGLSPGYPLPFIFAWVDPQDNVFEIGTMARVDEEILSVDLKHEEGQIPTLEIVIKNPRIGLLNPSRKQWAWLAYQPPPTSPGPAPFLEAGDFSSVPNGYGSSGSVVTSPSAVEGTPSYVADGYVQSGYQTYDGATIPLTPPVPTPVPSLTSPTAQTPVPPRFTPGTTIIPLFFGELVGVPSDLFSERITLKFLARPMDYIEQKQAAAETLKIPGNYEPIFLDEKHRDDPDAILEGWSSLYHVDRVTQAVSASDVLVGEDGTFVFAESPPSALYKSLKVKIGQAPLTNVQVQASVKWQQREVGYVNGPDVNVTTFTGTTFKADWTAMHGRDLGGGWTVESTYVNDPYMIEHTPTWHISSTTTFYGTLADYDCATVSISEAVSGPALLGPSMSAMIATTNEGGFCNPYSQPPANIPANLVEALVYVPQWSLNCSWTLRYNMKRDFIEMAFIKVAANAQAVLTSPTVEQDTLLIKMNGEVGQPVLIYDAWSDFAGQYVPFGQLIFPNDPTLAGGLSYQICVSPGIAGAVEPVFSDVPGAGTRDGGVVWASLGENPQQKIQRMTFATSYGVGTILVNVTQTFDVNSGTLSDTDQSDYYIVTGQSWESNSAYQLVTFLPPITESDQLLFPPGSQTVSIAPVSTVPSANGRIISGIPFDYTFPSNVVNIGKPSWLGIPVGGTAEDVTARFFFPSVRGQESIVYGINRARAKIRMRSRAVDVSWECPFDMVVGMSCRHNATIFDPRLPGGTATGKVTAYSMTASKGKMRGSVTIGCSVGYNAFGNPLPDISYTAPAFSPFDDGLAFPLGYLPCDGGVFTSTLDAQAAAIKPGLYAELAAQAIENPPVPTQSAQGGVGGATTVTTGVGPAASWVAGIDAAVLPELMESNPIGWTMEIQPVTNGPFSGSYTITVSPLELPMGIDLAANSQE